MSRRETAWVPFTMASTLTRARLIKESVDHYRHPSVRLDSRDFLNLLAMAETTVRLASAAEDAVRHLRGGSGGADRGAGGA